MSKQHGDQLIALRVWHAQMAGDNFYRGTLTLHHRDTDLYLFNHWGYKAEQNDKSELILALKSKRFVVDQLADETLRITQKRK